MIDFNKRLLLPAGLGAEKGDNATLSYGPTWQDAHSG